MAITFGELGTLGGGETFMPYLNHLNVHATRGPLTQEVLERHGVPIPRPSYRDPGILSALLFPAQSGSNNDHHKSILIPHIDDNLPRYLPEGFQVVTATTPVMRVMKTIAQADVVITSSLHAKILADTFGVPSVIYKGRTTTKFRFDDYALGAGQDELPFAEDASRALNEAPYIPKSLNRAVERLLFAFPKTIWN